MMTPKRLARDLTARLDGPHADEHTADAAHLTAEAVRFLNYATGSHNATGLEFPSTVYEITADLSLAASRLPQLLDQLGAWLAAEDAAGMLGTDSGALSADSVAAARQHLADAGAGACMLAAALSRAQNALAGVNGHGPNRVGRAA